MGSKPRNDFVRPNLSFYSIRQLLLKTETENWTGTETETEAVTGDRPLPAVSR